jgi:tetrahydrodipicolinate N-succinyltransferase
LKPGIVTGVVDAGVVGAAVVVAGAVVDDGSVVVVDGVVVDSEVVVGSSRADTDVPLLPPQALSATTAAMLAAASEIRGMVGKRIPARNCLFREHLSD